MYSKGAQWQSFPWFRMRNHAWLLNEGSGCAGWSRGHVDHLNPGPWHAAFDGLALATASQLHFLSHNCAEVCSWPPHCNCNGTRYDTVW